MIAINKKVCFYIETAFYKPSQAMQDQHSWILWGHWGACGPKLICSSHDIAGCVQNIFQNQPVHAVAMNVRKLVYVKIIYSYFPTL